MTLKARMPTKELWTVNKPQFAAAFLAAVIMGIVFVQNITMLTIWQSILGWLEMVLHTNSFVAAFTVTFLVVISVPTLLLLLASYMAKKANGDTMVKNFARFGYAIIALDVAGHIAHNLFHLLAEGGYVYITGMLFFGNEAHDMSPALVNGQVIQILQYFLIGLGVLGSLYAAYRIARSHYRQKLTATLLPYGALIVLLGVFNIILFSLPMVMRM